MTRFTYAALLTAVLVALSCSPLLAQRITVSVAGNGMGGFNGDGRPGHLTSVNTPQDICRDAAGNLYFTETDGPSTGRVRMLSAKNGTVSTVAGGGSSSADGIPATSASINPSNVCIDAAGNLYIVSIPGAIRKINMSTGIITTIAATGTTVNGICADASGNILFVDHSGNKIKKVNILSGITSTVAGTGAAGYSGDGGPAIMATLGNPYGICTNPAGEIIFDDQGGMESVIRKIDLSGNISTIAGTTFGSSTLYDCPGLSCWLGEVTGICCDDSGDVIFDEISCSCRRIKHSCDSVFQIGGNFYSQSYSDNVNANLANMNNPYGLCSAPGGTVYIADMLNYRIRKVIQLTPTPTFAFGHGQTITPCPGYTFVVDSQLAITDLDAGQTETWTVISAPLHGTLTGFPATGTSAGVTTIVMPSGVTYLAPSTYLGNDSFKVRVTDGLLSDTVTIYVSVQPGSAATISGTSNVCPGSTTPLSASIPGGIWGASNTHASINAGTGLVTGSSAGLDTIIYSVYLSCYTTSSIVVTVNPAPLPGYITGPDSLCFGVSATLTESVAGGVWSIVDSTIATLTPAGVVTGLSDGWDVIEYTTTNAWCSSVAYLSITVISGTSPITGIPSLCAGTAYPFYDGVPGGIWTSSNPHATVDIDGNVAGVSAGTVSIIYTNTSVCGTSSVTYPVTILALPDPGIISGPASVCDGSTITLASTVPGGTWSDLTGYTYVDPLTGDITGSFPGYDSIIYTFTDGTTGCSASTEVLVTIATTPDPGAIYGATSVCAGASISLTDPVSGGTWSVLGSGATVSITGDVTGLSVGTPSIIYSVTNACGTATATWPISVDPLPDAGSITGTSSVCPGYVILLSDGSTGGTWSVSNANASVSGTGTVSGINPGTDSVIYTVTNSCGTATTYHIVTILNCSLNLASAQAGQDLHIYPNPATDVLNIDWQSAIGNVSIVIRDLTGRELSRTTFNGSANTGKVNLSIADLKEGIYMMTINADSINYTEKLEIIK